jgi:NAD(P)H-flavin reductase
VIYRSELDALHDGAQVIYTLTRQQPPGWAGHAGRVTDALLREVAWPGSQHPIAYVCGPTAFVESVAAELVDLGYPGDRIKTERYGGVGGT